MRLSIELLAILRLVQTHVQDLVLPRADQASLPTILVSLPRPIRGHGALLHLLDLLVHVIPTLVKRRLQALLLGRLLCTSRLECAEVASVVLQLLRVVVQVHDVRAHHVQERTVVAHHHQRVRVSTQRLLQPQQAVDVHEVGRLIEQQHVWLHEQRTRQRHTHHPAARQLLRGSPEHLLAQTQPVQDRARTRLGGVCADLRQPRRHRLQLRHQLLCARRCTHRLLGRRLLSFGSASAAPRPPTASAMRRHLQRRQQPTLLRHQLRALLIRCHHCLHGRQLVPHCVLAHMQHAQVLREPGETVARHPTQQCALPHPVPTHQAVPAPVVQSQLRSVQKLPTSHSDSHIDDVHIVRVSHPHPTSRPACASSQNVDVLIFIQRAARHREHRVLPLFAVAALRARLHLLTARRRPRRAARAAAPLCFCPSGRCPLALLLPRLPFRRGRGSGCGFGSSGRVARSGHLVAHLQRRIQATRPIRIPRVLRVRLVARGTPPSQRHECVHCSCDFAALVGSRARQQLFERATRVLVRSVQRFHDVVEQRLVEAL
mmetsp:Transcript_29768/g.97418  ORF Transcript_29768/g.97418 Transcript_29768/m.97418 type:complete len:544 (+) Transcript_29768:571-2202(+)